jgi:hypothetical protein
LPRPIQTIFLYLEPFGHPTAVQNFTLLAHTVAEL